MERLVEVFCQFRVPEELHSDWDCNFEQSWLRSVTSWAFRRLRLCRSTHTTQLTIVTTKHQRDLDQHPPLVLLVCRSTLQESTRFTLALVMFGCKLRTPAKQVFSCLPG